MHFTHWHCFKSDIILYSIFVVWQMAKQTYTLFVPVIWLLHTISYTISFTLITYKKLFCTDSPDKYNHRMTKMKSKADKDATVRHQIGIHAWIFFMENPEVTNTACFSVSLSLRSWFTSNKVTPPSKGIGLVLKGNYVWNIWFSLSAYFICQEDIAYFFPSLSH